MLNRPLFLALRATSLSSPLRPLSFMSTSLPTRRSKRSASSATSPVKEEETDSSAAAAPLAASPVKKPRLAASGSTPSPTKTPTGKGKGKGKAGSTPSPVKKAAAYQASPYPSYARPTAEDCQRVTDKLAQMHGMPVRKAVGVKIEGGALGQACECIADLLLSRGKGGRV